MGIDFTKCSTTLLTLIIPYNVPIPIIAITVDESASSVNFPTYSVKYSRNELSSYFRFDGFFKYSSRYSLVASH